MEKETLEEAARKYCDNLTGAKQWEKVMAHIGFEKGANWQSLQHEKKPDGLDESKMLCRPDPKQEKKYSESEMGKICNEYYHYLACDDQSEKGFHQWFKEDYSPNKEQEEKKCEKCNTISYKL